MAQLRFRLVAMSGLLAGIAAAHATPVASSFDAGRQGWKVANVSDLPGAGVAAGWDAAGQRLNTGDLFALTTFSAPLAYLGNQSAQYGLALRFDLMDRRKDADADKYATVGLLGAGGDYLLWFGGAPSTSSMTTYTAALSELDPRWRLNATPDSMASGSAPTAAQFKAVLGNLVALRINADWYGGNPAVNDDSYLDNVVLGAVPEPQAWGLLAAGLAALAVTVRRRRT